MQQQTELSEYIMGKLRDNQLSIVGIRKLLYKNVYYVRKD